MIRSTVFLACTSVAGLASAHHSTAPFFDGSQTIEVSGTVTSINYNNPHGQIIFDVRDESGEIVVWEAEIPGMSVMRNNNTNPEGIIAVGDRVTVAGSPSRRNLPSMVGRSVLLPSGYEFDFGFGRPHFPAGINGRIIGGEPTRIAAEESIAAADGIFRVWSAVIGDPASFPMFNGQYPVNEAGRAIVAEWDPFDNPLLRCGSMAMPRIMGTAFPFEFVRDGEDIRMVFETGDLERYVHMNDGGTPPDGHTAMGFSRGRFEGRTLVVETDRVAAGYLDRDGVPHSENIRIIEHYTPTEDYSRLNLRATVTDPEFFDGTFDITRYFAWQPGDIVQPYECVDREY